MKTSPRALTLLCLLGLLPVAAYAQTIPSRQAMGGTDATFNNAAPPAAITQPTGGTLTFTDPPPPPPPPPPSNPDSNPVPPAPTGVIAGISGGYDAEQGRKFVTCTAPTQFNTYFNWPLAQGNKADHYILTLVRHGTTVTLTRKNADILCNTGNNLCNGYLNLTVAQVQGLIPEINWATTVWDHLEWTTPAHTGIAIYGWMMNSNLTIKACNSAGSCNSSTSTSMNLSVFSNGQRDCQAMSGGAPKLNPPQPSPPPGSVR